MITPDGTKKYLQEVGPPIGGEISNWRWHLQSEVDLQLEVKSLIGGPTSDQGWDLWSEVRSPIGGPTSNWRWHLWSEVGPPIGGTHVTCRNQLFFWKKKRLFIVDYMKPSPVYRVKCKLVVIFIYNIVLMNSRELVLLPY